MAAPRFWFCLLILGLFAPMALAQFCGGSGEPNCTGIIYSYWSGANCTGTRSNSVQETRPGGTCFSLSSKSLVAPYDCAETSGMFGYESFQESGCTGVVTEGTYMGFGVCLEQYEFGGSFAYFCNASFVHADVRPRLPSVVRAPIIATPPQPSTPCAGVDACDATVWRTQFSSQNCQTGTAQLSLAYMSPLAELGTCYEVHSAEAYHLNVKYDITPDGYFTIAQYSAGCEAPAPDALLHKYRLDTCYSSSTSSYIYRSNTSLIDVQDRIPGSAGGLRLSANLALLLALAVFLLGNAS